MNNPEFIRKLMALAVTMLNYERDQAEDCVNTAVANVLSQECVQKHNEPYICTAVINQARQIRRASGRRRRRERYLYDDEGVFSEAMAIPEVTSQSIEEKYNFVVKKYLDLRSTIKTACLQPMDALIRDRKPKKEIMAEFGIDRRRFGECIAIVRKSYEDCLRASNELGT